MQKSRLLEQIYTFFLGVLLALFVGVGISTFYTSPTSPVYPTELNTYGKDLTDTQIELQHTFDAQNETYMEKMKSYNRNVSIIAVVAAVALLAISILFEHKIKFVADGVMLGGLFTLIYSIGRGFASENNKYVFIIVAVGLATVIYLGYRKFVEHDTANKGKNE